MKPGMIAALAEEFDGAFAAVVPSNSNVNFDFTLYVLLDMDLPLYVFPDFEPTLYVLPELDVVLYV